MLRSVPRTLGSKAENHRTIAIVTPYFLPVSAGIEVYVANLSRRLKDEYRVIIYAAGRAGVLRYEDMEVKRYRSFDYQKLPVRHKVAYPFPFTMLRDLTNDQIDLINAHGHDFFTSYLAALAARRRKIPFVLTVHSIGLAYLESFLVRMIKRILNPSMVAYTVRSADVVIALNAATREYVSKDGARVVKVIYQGVDTDKFFPSYSPYRLVTFVGRLVSAKAPDVFLRAIPLVLRKLDARFMVVGNGPLKKELEILAERLAISDHVTFLGEISHDRVPEVLGNSSVLAVPYLGGLVLLEAMAMMKPIVCAETPWAREVAGDAAYYIIPKDANDLASGIVRVLEDANLSKKLAQSGYERVMRGFSWESVAEQYKEIFSSLLKQDTNVREK